MNNSERELETKLADERSRIRNGPMKTFMRIIGVSAAVLVILTGDGLGPTYLDSAGRCLFWTATVLGPMFAFNLDVIRTVLGVVAAIGLVALQLLLVFCLFNKLNGMSFILLAPICLAQCLLFEAPFMLIRKRYSGIWY